ncbi:Uncharacterised protein [uncultured archaeon]|nr:Uncharacterised protein [uncultured archaeon]
MPITKLASVFEVLELPKVPQLEGRPERAQISTWALPPGPMLLTNPVVCA